MSHFFSGGEILKEKAKRGLVCIVGTDTPVTFPRLEEIDCSEHWKDTIEKARPIY